MRAAMMRCGNLRRADTRCSRRRRLIDFCMRIMPIINERSFPRSCRVGVNEKESISK
jgi:hypothetical protein